MVNFFSRRKPTSHVSPSSDIKDEVQFAIEESLALRDSPQARLDLGRTRLLNCATHAVFISLLQRTVALPDLQLSVLVNGLQCCGMIADETGNLLPALLKHFHHKLIIENNAPSQLAELTAVLEIEELNSWLHSRSIRPDVVQFLAETVRANFCESLIDMRKMLSSRVDLQAYSRLLDECKSLCVTVKREEDAKSMDVRQAYWGIAWYGPIADVETWANTAIRSANCYSGKRRW